ncbi:MAG TPA: hypothetical protein VGR14_18745 [Verrucomicrobiae bacterium]|jgi:hypothetical protein|nr:hypothetical protein [Verrucomicrobiae bacterium]
MTAYTPAPKASGVSALLASLSAAPTPPPPPSANDNFLAVMLQALVTEADGTDHPTSAQPAQEKTSAKEADVPDQKAARLLLASLAPPLPDLPKPPSYKASATSMPVVGSDSTSSSAPAQTEKEKPAPTPAALDLTAASLLLGLLAPPLLNLAKPLSHKASAPAAPVAPTVPPTPSVSTVTAGESNPAKTDASEKTPSLLAQVSPTKEPEVSPAAISGTSAANTTPRMSFPSERNEIAGRTEQKLPPPGISAVSSADAGGSSPDGGAKSSLTFSWHDAPTEPLTIVDLSAKAAAPVFPLAEVAVDAPVQTSSTTPLERLEQMISREVVSVRQFGAQTLGVTLKLDVNTQLYLELTTHNGSVQASVRAERGNFAPEDAQWAQLQQSLARQNVELLPMTGSSNLNFKQPSDERPRQPVTREDWPVAGAAVQPAQPRKRQQEQNRSRKNWESWA